MIRQLLVQAIIFTSIQAYAQDSLFSKVYVDQAWSIESRFTEKSFNDGLIIGGRYQYNNTFITSLDSLGNINWYKMHDYTSNFNTADVDFIRKTSDSAYMLSGQVYADARNRWDAGLMKLDQNGDTLWTRAYGVTTQTNCNSTGLATKSDSSTVIAWTCENDTRLFLCNISYDGNIIWSSILTGSEDIEISRLVIVADTNVYVGIQNTTSMKASILSLNEFGQLNWAKEYAQSTIFDLGVADSNLLMLSLNYPTGNLNITKVDPSGNALWQQEYINQNQGWTSFELPTLTVMSDLSIILNNPDNSGSVTLVLDQDGNPLYGAWLQMILSGAVEATNKGLFLVGNGPIYGIKKSLVEHIGLVRADATLHGANCISPYTEPTPFVPFYSENSPAYTQTSGVNQYYTLLTVNDLFMDDQFLGCVADIGGVNELDNSYDISVYPNVSKGIFQVRPEFEDHYGISIHDQFGRCIYSDQSLSNEEIIDISGNPNGLYYYSIMVKDYRVKSGKIIINQ